jgi:hypothetical protein
MVIKNLRFSILIIFLLFTLLPVLEAQDMDTHDENIEPRHTQRLSWRSDGYALFYEVEIEVLLDGGIYASFHHEYTQEQFIEVSLSPGGYRYRVTPYDILERPCETSPWLNFIVLQIPSPVEIVLPFPVLGSPLKSFSMGWMPVIPITTNIFGDEIYFIGAAANMGVLFAISRGFYIGPEAVSAWYVGQDGQNMLTVGMNLLSRVWLPRQVLAFSIRAGAEYNLLYESSFNVSAGASLVFRIFNVLVETGANYTTAVSGSGALRPFAGLVYQF